VPPGKNAGPERVNGVLDIMIMVDQRERKGKKERIKGFTIV